MRWRSIGLARARQLRDQIQFTFAVAGARQPMHVAQRGVDAGVAHQALQAFHLQAGGQLVGGIGMAKRMDTADLGHPGLLFGAGVGLLQTGGR